MLFDTLKKRNQAEQEEQAWNAQRPADYVSANKDAMDNVTGQLGSGFDFDTASKAYQQYRQQAQANAGASAEDAKANAALLAGGYGSSYADSVAAQGAQQALSGIDNALPNLRSQALTEYQNQQNSLLNALSGMANTEALDQSAYGLNLANYQNRQAFLANQSEQARNENDNYWNNLWNKVLTAGNVVKSTYDSYMGYSQQNAASKVQAIQQAMTLKQNGATDAANAVLDTYGIGHEVLDNYTGMTPERAASLYDEAMNLTLNGSKQAGQNLLTSAGLDATLLDSYDGPMATWKDKISGVTSASGLAANGDDAGAGSILTILGMPVNSVSGYNTLSEAQMDQTLKEYAAKQKIAAQYKTTGSGSRSSGSSGGSKSGNSGSQWTNSQLRQMASDYKKMKPTDELYGFYRNTLIDNGWIQDDSSQTEGTTPTGTDTGNTGKTQNSEKHVTPVWARTDRVSMGQFWAADQANKGKTNDQIIDELVDQGYTNDEIYQIVKKLK